MGNQFEIMRSYRSSVSSKPRSSTISNYTDCSCSILDLCLEFPNPSKEEEFCYNKSQKLHNMRVQNSRNVQMSLVGQDLFHEFHIAAWKAKKDKESKQKKKHNVQTKKRKKRRKKK